MIITCVIIAWHILCFWTWCLPVKCPEGATDVLNTCDRFWVGQTISNGIQKWITWNLVVFAYLGLCPTSLYFWKCQGEIQGKFYQKLKDDAYQLKQLELYTPQLNATEREVQKLKKGASHKVLKSKHQSTDAWRWNILGPITAMMFIN